MVDQKDAEVAEWALRIINYLKLFQSTSGFGKIVINVRHNEFHNAEVTIYDHRKAEVKHRA